MESDMASIAKDQLEPITIPGYVPGQGIIAEKRHVAVNQAVASQPTMAITAPRGDIRGERASALLDKLWSMESKVVSALDRTLNGDSDRDRLNAASLLLDKLLPKHDGGVTINVSADAQSFQMYVGWQR